MKKFMLFFALSMVMSVTVRAQLCDFTDLFHYGQTDSPRTVFLCEGDSKHTVWMNNVVDYFRFDSNGNLVSRNEEKYTHIVRDDSEDFAGNLTELVRGNLRIQVFNFSIYTYSKGRYKIIVAYDDAKTGEEKWLDEYQLNKQFFPIKRIRKYPSGEKSVRTYKYIDYTDNGVWYIRKVKDSDRLGKSSWYECLKTM
ncbi:hypothetical protein [Phocaeicola barnesiae]